ncbi:MAG: adenylate kinase [Planctomycetaceae bacterium]|nr:adenylate kinase [Planctomycetaceae bacterium]
MSERYPTVLMFGPPGSGKGTQGKAIGTIPGFFHLSCGDVFRQLNANSELGRVFLEYSTKGELVPDDVTVRMWHAHLQNQAQSGQYDPAYDLLILDGIPRNAPQAGMLDAHIDVLKIVHLVCSDDEAMIERLRRRALKENRLDDTKEDVIRNRWRVYEEETTPVLAHYDKGLIADVDALPTPAEVLHGVLEVLIPVQKAYRAQVED